MLFGGQFNSNEYKELKINFDNYVDLLQIRDVVGVEGTLDRERPAEKANKVIFTNELLNFCNSRFLKFDSWVLVDIYQKQAWHFVCLYRKRTCERYTYLLLRFCRLNKAIENGIQRNYVIYLLKLVVNYHLMINGCCKGKI